ncbi:amidohydrolase family protein [Pelomonas sp. KK5]|uniref:amidohydrolase family protein n=1 Tax=Pelomonas sp. KK5 TaxID=1855730 RepID=UPI00097BCE1F|nr:amidohydrolase family protein [Pelomonas sp. KK5]
MRRSLFPLLAPLITAIFSGAVHAQTEPFKASAQLSFALVNAQWFDGQGFRKGALYVVNGKFTDKKPARVNRRMDLKNQFMIPPLGEAHNYNLQTDWGVEHYEQRYLQDGVLYAAMLCADPADLAAVRPKLNTEDSPDVVFASACITSGDGQPLAALLAAPNKPRLADIADKAVIIMDKPADVDAKWKLVASRKPDFIRLTLSYSDKPELRGKPEMKGRLGLDAETAAAIVQHAHQAGLKVSANVDSAGDFDAAVKAGVDNIAHLPGYFNHHGDGPERYVISAESAAQAARQKTTVTTATIAGALFKAAPEQAEMLRQLQLRNLQTLKTAGVTLLLGSDVFTGTSQLELAQLAGTGAFSNAELLKMATMDTPRALFPKRQIGCFEPGCEASFLLLASDPLQDIKAAASPMFRVKQGRILTQVDDVAETNAAATESSDDIKKGKAGGKKGAKSGKGAKGKAGASKPAGATTRKPAAKAQRKS